MKILFFITLAAIVAFFTFGCVTTTETGVIWQTIIHGAFILSAIGIAWTDKIMAHAGKTKVAAAAH